MLDYTRAFVHPIRPGLEKGFSAGPLTQNLFEYWRWTDVTPDMAEKILREEAAQKSGYYSGFLFNICEYWYPCSDSRAVKSTAVASAIPRVITAYTAYLQKGSVLPVSSRYLVSASTESYSDFESAPLIVADISDVSVKLFKGQK